MGHTIKRFLEVHETIKELLLVFQMPFRRMWSICSVLLLCDMTPACSSSKILTVWFTVLLRLTLNITCVTNQIWQSRVLPFSEEE